MASAEDLAPQDEDTIRVLKKNCSYVPENLSPPNQRGWSVFPAATEEEDVRKGIMSFYAWASAGPDHLHFRSLMAHGLDEAGSHLSIRINRPGQCNAETGS